MENIKELINNSKQKINQQLKYQFASSFIDDIKYDFYEDLKKESKEVKQLMEDYIKLINIKTTEYLENKNVNKVALDAIKKDKATQVYIYQPNNNSKPRNATIEEIISLKLQEIESKHQASFKTLAVNDIVFEITDELMLHSAETNKKLNCNISLEINNAVTEIQSQNPTKVHDGSKVSPIGTQPSETNGYIYYNSTKNIYDNQYTYFNNQVINQQPKISENKINIDTTTSKPNNYGDGK